MKENIIQQKSFSFAIRIVKLYKYLISEKKEFVKSIKNYELKIKSFKVKENIIQQKSFSFAIRIVNLYKYLISEKREFVLSKQLLRSGTSIGANIEESIGGQSEKDFLSKLSISYKEQGKLFIG